LQVAILIIFLSIEDIVMIAEYQEPNGGVYESFVREALIAWKNTDIFKAGNADSFVLNYARKKDEELKNING
jgi:hypothetical protein